MEEIKAQDLMIGNYIRDIHSENGFFKVITLRKCTAIYGNFYSGRYEYLRGIPLTEDILLKAGATPYTAKDTFILGNIIIDIKLGIVMLDCIDYTPLLCKCKYLHTFQNIVKLLTGNDLKIEV